jgi:phage terminase small subunit
MEPTAAPRHLRPETAQFWDLTVESYDLAPHHVKLLTLVCDAWDSHEAAREAIAADGAYLPARDGGKRAHPAVAVMRDSRIAVARLLRELNLEDSPGDSRPARISGRYAS